MKVSVRLYAFLPERVPEKIRERYPEGIRPGSRLELELPEGTTLMDLTAHLALPKEQVKLTVVNGRMREPDYRLQPQDEIGIFPPIAGG